MTHTSTTADPVQSIVSLTNAAAAARCLHVVAELGVADTISPDEEVSIDVLADRCGCHPDALHRLLRCSRCTACSTASSATGRTRRCPCCCAATIQPRHAPTPG